MSDCSLLFSIGTFHTNSVLCHPVDSTTRFRRSHLLLDSTVLSLRHCRCHMAAVACPRHPCRGSRRRRHNPTSRGGSETRNPTPAADVGGTTLPPASAGVRADPGRDMPNGSAALCAEDFTPLQSKVSKPCVPLHFKRNSPAGRSRGGAPNFKELEYVICQ